MKSLLKDLADSFIVSFIIVFGLGFGNLIIPIGLLFKARQWFKERKEPEVKKIEGDWYLGGKRV